MLPTSLLLKGGSYSACLVRTHILEGKKEVDPGVFYPLLLYAPLASCAGSDIAMVTNSHRTQTISYRGLEANRSYFLSLL